jgi:hypothetical protein
LQGIISEEKVEAFNLPIYISPAKDLEALLQRNGFFSVEKIDRITSNMNITTLTAQFLTSQLRAITEELIKGHFGSEICCVWTQMVVGSHVKHGCMARVNGW